MSLSTVRNIEDLRQMAKRRLPSPIFHYLDGGADDEWTLNNNTNAFDKIRLIPRALVDVSNIDLSTTVYGQKVDWPVLLSPTGMTRLFHQHGEKAVARVAEAFGTIYGLSTLATSTIEDVGKATNGPKVFQIYILKDKGLNREIMDRCKAAGFDALTLTVDVPVAGNRERDLLTGMTMPPKLTPSSILSFLMHPRWTLDYLFSPRLEMANIASAVKTGSAEPSNIAHFATEEMDHSVSWRDAAEMIKYWGGPFSIKGILSADDARRAMDIGASGVVVSNHGGRQLDGAAAPIEVLETIVDTINNQIDIILESGVRRGTHVVKALAMGATAVSVGRCYLYGLSAAGEKGAMRAMELLRAETERAMALTGCASVSALNRSFIL